MLLEQRTYRVQPGRMADYLALVEHELLPIAGPALGGSMGYFRAETGRLDEIVHLWIFDDAADRDQRRAALAARPEWQSALAKARPMLCEQHSRLFVAATFNPKPGTYGVGHPDTGA